jgi:predicted metalloprotease with PDZ domain
MARRIEKGPVKAKKTKSEQLPVDHVVKATELELATFKALDAEVKNSLQGMRNIDLEMKLADIEHSTVQEGRKSFKVQLKGLYDVKYKEYAVFIETLAKKHNLDPSSFSIVIHDLRNDATKD